MLSGGAGFPDDPERATRVLEQRLQRQQVINRSDDPLKFHTIIDEGALRREVGGRRVTRRQWAHLVDIDAHSQVTLQVLPYKAGVHPGQLGTFSVLDFPSPDDPGIVYLETWRGGLYLEENDELDDYRLAFDKLAGLALDPADSLDFLKKLARSSS